MRHVRAFQAPLVSVRVQVSRTACGVKSEASVSCSVRVSDRESMVWSDKAGRKASPVERVRRAAVWKGCILNGFCG